MKRFLKIVLLAIIVIVIASGAWTAKQLYSRHQGYARSLILIIPPGERAPEVASLLVARGVLARRLPFLLRYWLGRRRRMTLKFGEYQFNRPLTPLEVYDKLVRGEVYLHTVVVPEGSDRFDMARIYQRELGLDPAAFIAATRDPTAIRDLDPRAPSLEGYLFPDTYRFPRGVTANKVVETMLARFRGMLSSQAARSGGLHDVLTLASLVEKETPDPPERPEIAGVFARRLEKGMNLDCDPTVIYALRLAADSIDPAGGHLTRSDLETPSPYNTYSHPGLPPGPICSPGAASIRAALSPAAGHALYFVSNDHGGHLFASTLAEHHRNVERYREALKKRPEAPNRKAAKDRSH